MPGGGHDDGGAIRTTAAATIRTPPRPPDDDGGAFSKTHAAAIILGLRHLLRSSGRWPAFVPFPDRNTQRRRHHRAWATPGQRRIGAARVMHTTLARGA